MLCRNPFLLDSCCNLTKIPVSMESTMSASTTTLLGVSKCLHCSNPGGQNLRSRIAFIHLQRITTAAKADLRRSTRKVGSASPLFGLRNVGGPVPSVWCRLECVSSSAASFASPSGGGGVGGGGYSGGGGGGGDRGEVKANPITVGADDGSAFSSDVIILDVGGMTCGGCAASVKRILESQPLVSSASVNLTTETAIVWPISEAKVKPDWQKVLGEELAKHLTTCGFNSNLRDSKKGSVFETFQKKVEEKRNQLKESGRGLAVSWALCAVCLFGHVSHFIGAKAWWIHGMHSTGFHLSLSLFTLLVPGRQLIVDGLKSLMRGTPNMNTLVGLGAVSSFAVSSLAALIPKLGWKAFFEEPIMLIAFVLLGRNLKQRAKIKATSDMTALLSVLPSKARLQVNGDGEDLTSTVDVPCDSLSVGDKIVVLPGDRVPADGIVRAGIVKFHW